MVLCKLPNTFESVAPELTNCRRRRDCVRMIHAIWTDGGKDDSGLADPLFDGRIDVLGLFMIGTLFDEVDYLEDIHLDDNNMEIDQVDPTNFSYDDFYSYMSRNEPILFKRGLTDNWPATRDWIIHDGSTHKPNLKYLCLHFGGDLINVHVQSSKGFEGSTFYQRQTVDMTLDEYATWWEEYSKNLMGPIYYMKDWKFVAAHKNYIAYVTPGYFRDDWLNASTIDTFKSNPTLQGMGDAYKFCYLGPAGSITPLHADVLNSYSWSSNICGCKKWWMVPPRFTHLLYDSLGQKLASHMHSDLDLGKLGKAIYPGLSMARRHSLTFLQRDKEIVFVPSGWHHTVENVDDTISINHNWINGTNMDWSWEKVLYECETFTKTSDQMKDASEQNESKLSLSYMDDFYLLFLVLERKAKVTINEHSTSIEETTGGSNALFNLNKIVYILDSMYTYLVKFGETALKITPDDVMYLKVEVKKYIDEMSKHGGKLMRA